MISYRSLVRFFLTVLALALPITASAASFDVKALVDTDNNRSTGCTVVTVGGIVSGIDAIVTTTGTVTGGTGTVTAVTRQACVGSTFGPPTTLDGGWPVGVSPTGDLLIESHFGHDIMTMDNVGTPRFVFTTSTGLLTDVQLTPFSWGGGDIVLTHAARDRAVATRPLRVIALDGNGSDWDGVPPIANGTETQPSWRFISTQVYAGINDFFFNFQIHTNPAAPTAHDDHYALGTLGGTLTVSTLGVLNNDNPNGQPITATLIDGAQHGSVALNPNGGFTYTHDGSLASQDRFRYVDTGTPLLSNIATVLIDLPGDHPYIFTSADHATFIAGQSNTFLVTVSGKPVPALTEEGALPAGVFFSDNGDGTGTLSGTPAASTVGVYTFIFSAEKNKPHQSSQNFTLTITCPTITVTNPVTTTGPAGAAFSQTFTQSGGSTPIVWSETGALPTGLTFHTATGVLDGTPAQAGTFPITVKATDASGCIGTGPTYNLTITCNTVTVTNPATSTGTVNVAFSQTFTQSGAIGGATFSLNSGTLPAGLTLSTAGVLSGTPTQSGSFPITVKVTAGNGCIGIGPTYNLVINCQVITVTNPATNTGTANTAFSQTFTAANTIGAVTFTTASPLPTGLTLSAGGVLSGTPTQTGPFPIVVKATDANGCFGNGATYTLTISCQTITVTNPATTTGTVSAAFSQTFTQSGGIGASTFTLASGSLPAGLTLSSGGVLSGAPTVIGSFAITVKATDSNGCNGTGATYTLVISCQTITVTNPATTTGTAGTLFSQTFTQTSAVGGATFSLNSGSLPTGLTLATNGTLSGTPAVVGSFPITVKVTDGNGCTGIGPTYTLVISCQTITVTNPATTTGTAGTAFSQTFTESGSIGGSTFSLNSGSLPAGLTLSSAGLLSGTPTVVGSFPITVKVTDGNACTGISATYTLVINCQTITVTNPATSTGVAGAAFSQTFTQSGSIGGPTFSLATGTLPTGLSLSSAGVLSGTPAQTGSFPITVKVTDGNGCTGTGPTYTLVISCQTITVTNPATTAGTAGTPFSQTFTQSSAIGGATFTLNSGSLPTGLTLSAAGVLSGTPAVTGSFPITVKVTDGNGCTGVGATYTLVIGCQTITVTNPATTTGTVNAAFSQTFTQSGAIGGATFTLNSGSLPAGLSLSTAGVLSGTPTVNGSFPITVKVTDGNGCTGVSATYTLVINCQTITVTNPGVNTGTVAVGFSQTFTQTGAQGTATFTTASTLPTGFTLSTAGVLSGTTNQHNTFPIVVTVTDSNGCTGTSATYTLIISCQTITVTNASSSSIAAGTPLPAGNFTFTQSGSIGGATFTTASTLPTGVSLTTAGVLTGTPTQGGSFPIVVTVTDGNGCTGTNPAYTLTITCPTITVTNPGVSAGTVDAAFSQTFTQAGGTPTVNFTLNSGSLPAGLSLSTAGVLSGTPTVPGSFPITVKATDANGCTGVGATYTLVISCQIIAVTNPGVTTGTVDAAFSQTFTQSGVGTHTPATFTLNSGSLPAGLSLSAAGVLSGTPAVPGSFPITVTVTDVNGCFGIGATYTLVISCQTITVTKPVTTTGTVNAPFSQTFTQSGVGTHTPATFTLNSGSLPAGLSLSTAGVLSGTPSVPGSFPITVKVTDANGCTGISTTYTLVISCQTITVTNPATTTGTVGVAFSQTFTQSGAQGTATFTTASTLPTGFSLSTAGVLSGTTNQHASFPIVVTVTDSNGCTGTSATYTLVISCQTITVTNPGVTTGTVGTPFSQTFTQSGANGGATFTTASTLPTGLTLSTAGLLAGTPLQSGTFPIVVTVTDGNGCTGTGATYTLIIACNVITVTNPGTTTGTVDAAFSQTFTQTGGNGTVNFTLNSGSLPAGLTLATTGVLSGTPGAPGSFPITVKATDANGCTGISSTYTLVINCQTITVTNPGVTTGTVDAPFSQTFTQSGVGTHTPAVFSLNSGSLAGTGLSLSAAGVLSGTPSAPGTIVITVKVTDANGCTGISATYTLVIACQTITVTNPITTSGIISTAFSQTFTQSGVGTHTPIVWSKSGTLPNGITLNSATGVLSGTPTQTGTFPITVTATDANGCFGTGATYTLSIAPSAGADSYSNLVDNTQFVVTGGATGSPATPFVGSIALLTANDLPAGGVTVNGGVFGTTAGGSVTLASDGTFIYTPKANPNAAATTSDSFTYTVSSNTGGVAAVNSAAATVTLTLANRVWYVKNNAAGGGNGQSQSPFNTLATAGGTASTANDIIFVYNGDGTNTGQNAGITLKNGQQLLGEINGLTVNAQTLVAVGSRPTIGNSGGAAVTVAASTANGDRTGIFIKGLSMAGTTNAIDISSANAQTLTTTVDNVNITAATANHGVKIAAAATLTSTVTVQNSTVLAAGQNGIDAQQTTAGNLVLNINNNNISASGFGININGAGSTSTTITNFDSNTVTGLTGGTGISVASATFDATPGGAFTTVTGGTTNIGTSGNPVGTNGMLLSTVKGDISFTTLNIYNSAGTGLLVSSTGAVNIGAGTGFRIVVGAGATFDSNGGPVVDVNNASINMPGMTFLRSTNSTTTGISLVSAFGGVGSTTLFASSGQIADPGGASGTAVNINGGNGSVTIGFPIINTSGNAIVVTGRGSDTVTFSGTVSETGSGISLTSNTGATISFTGAITASTGSNAAFTATGGGTVTATDTTSTLTTTTGTALNVANTSIGAGGLKFKSITAGTAASGPANGIILNNTGASGGLTVVGTGSAGGGGTIQKTTGSGISLTSVGGSASFTDMNISNTASDGITGATVNNFTCVLCVITNPGTSANKDGLRLTELSGTATITNTTVTGATTDGCNITNASATLTSLAISGGSFGSTNNAFASADSGLIVIAKTTGVITAATVSGVTFNANFSSALQSFAQDTATIGDITVSGCTFTNNGAAAADFDAGTGSNPQMKFHFLNNLTINGNVGPTVNVFSSSTATGGLIQGRIDGNHIGTAGSLNSGSTGGAGIRVFLQGVAGNITIVNNVIRETSCSRGIEVQTLGPVPANGGTRQSDIVITGNDVDNVATSCPFPLNDIYLTSDNQAGGAGTTLRAEVHNNKIKSAGASPGNTDIPFDNLEWLYFDKTAGTAQLVKINAGSATANADIAATQTSGSAKANAGVALIAGPITTIP